MEVFKRECKLCDNTITGRHFRVIEECIKNVFDVLLLKLTLDNDTQNVMCMACSSKLLAALNFKSTCLYVDNSIIPDNNFGNKKPVVLWEIYVKANGIKQETDTLEDQDVCRLCLHLTNSENKSIQEVSVDNIQIYIPEIDFALSTNPVICIKCHDDLNMHSGFLRNCSEVENRKRNAVTINADDILHPPIIPEENEIKPEPVDEEMLCEIKKEIHHEGDTPLRSQNSLVDAEGTKSLYSLEDMKPTCIDLTSVKDESKEGISEITPDSQWADQESLHKVDSEAQVTNSESVEQDEPETLQMEDDDPSEVELFMCGDCSYISIHEQSIKRHMLTHKNPSQLKM